MDIVIKILIALVVVSIKMPGVAMSRTKTLRIAASEIPADFEPLQNEISTNKISKQVFDTLTKADSAGNPLPSIATSWVISRAQKSIRFEIRKNVAFSNGSLLTTADVRQSLIASIAKGSLISSLVLENKECGPAKCSVVQADAHSVTVLLNDHTYDLFLRACGGSIGSIFRTVDGKLIGTGPFYIKEYTAEKVLLERRVVDKSSTQVSQISIEKMSSEKMKSEFLQGNLDELWAIPLTEAEAKKAGSTEITYSSFATYQFVMNVRSGIFTNPFVRKAFAHALDPRKVLDAHGIKGDIAGGYIPLGLLGHRKQRFKLDPSLAADQMKQYFKTNKTKIVRFAAKDSLIANKPFINALEETLKQLGLQLKVDAMSFRETLKAMKLNTHDIIFKGSGVQYYASSTMFVALQTGNFSNVNGYSNPNLDKLVSQAQSSESIAMRAKYLQDVENIVAKDIPTVPLYYPVTQAYYSDRLSTGLDESNELRFWEFPYREFRWKK